MNERRPVEGRAIGQTNDDPNLGARRTDCRMKAADIRGRLPKGRPHGMIELANAPVTGAEGDFGDRKLRFHDQVSRDEHAMRPRNLQRRSAEMLLKKAAQMARTDAYAVGKLLQIAAIQRALGDQLERPGYDSPGSKPR